jgi:peptide/nickel transport system ATP-binding protein
MEVTTTDNNTVRNNTLLEVRALDIRYPNRLAVWGIHFSVQKGELLALVGESGSGKSSLALAIGRLLPTDTSVEGSIMYRGVDLLQLPPEALLQYRGRRIAYVFQDPALGLNPNMRCGEQVAETLRLHTDTQASAIEHKTIEWFKNVHLDDPERIALSYPYQISGGQRQRVMIAMALAGQPELLVADEPTASLDPELRDEILELLRSLQRQYTMSLLLISHDLGAVQHLADRVLVLKEGQLVDNVPVTELQSAQLQPYTRALLACRPDPARPLTRLLTLDDIEAGRTQPERTPKPIVLDRNQEVPLVNLPHINLSYPSAGFWRKKPPVVVLTNGTFQIYPGEIVGLVGPSGSGKSSLGSHVLKISGGAGQGAIMIGQNPAAALNPLMTVADTLAEPLLVHRLVPDRIAATGRVRQLLEQVGLSYDEIGARYTQALSGGQQQRVCIARALAIEPRLLICDEVVASLDVSVQAQIINLLSDLRETRQLAILFISHDRAVVQHLCDRVLEIRERQLVAMESA